MTDSAKACLMSALVFVMLGLAIGFVVMAIINPNAYITATFLLIMIAGSTSSLITYLIMSRLEKKKDGGTE